MHPAASDFVDTSYSTIILDTLHRYLPKIFNYSEEGGSLQKNFSKSNMGCLNSLTVGALASTFFTNPTPILVSGLGCLPTSKAKQFPKLADFLSEVDRITNAIDNFKTINEAVFVTERVKGALGNVRAGNDDDLTLLAKAILETASDIQTILNPLESIVSSTTTAFANEALSRFSTLADLMHIRGSIYMMFQTTKKLEKYLADVHTDNTNTINDFKRALKISTYENLLKKFRSQSAGSLQYVQELEAEIATITRDIAKYQRDIEIIERDGKGRYDELLNALENKVDLSHETIDRYRQTIRDQKQLLSENQKLIDEAENTLRIRLANLNTFKQAQNKINDSHNNQILSIIRNLSDHIKAKELYYNLEVARANKKLNS